MSLTLLKGWFTPSRAAKVFQSTQSSERQLIDQVLELANCSLLVQNITAQGGRYSFLSLIREYCRRKEMDQRFSQVFHNARNQCIDYFLNFLKDIFKMFLSRNALKSITDFQQEELKKRKTSCSFLSGLTRIKWMKNELWHALMYLIWLGSYLPR